jgi:tetratricopeptide (TPR) repeat protein
MMPDLTQTFFDIPLWLWLIGIVAIIFIAIVIARKMEFEGVNITATPPFFQFRFKRKSAREQTRQDSEIPMGLSTFGGIHQSGGTMNAQRDIVGGNVTNINLPPPPRAPEGSAAPPARTQHYVQRGKIQNDVRAALEANSTVAVVGVAGMGGIGKTELANYLYRELRTTHRVIWIGVYNRPVGDLQGELGRVLGITFLPNADETSRYETLLAAFRENPCIVVFDDVSKAAIPHLKFLLPPSPPCAALITSRQRELGGGVRVFELDVMTLDQSLELLREAHSLGEVMEREPNAAKKLCELCGYLPLALDLAASRLRKQLHFSDTPIAAFNPLLANRLEELQRHQDPDPHLISIKANIDLSYFALEDADKRRLRALAVFAPSGFMPRAAAALWSESEADACKHIERLQDESLVMNAKEKGRFKLHDLIRDYATHKLDECGESDVLNRAHAEFLIALFVKHSQDDLSNAPAVGNELENLTTAANWACMKREGELLARLSTAPRNWLYNIFRAWDDWLTWLNESLRIGNLPTILQANVRKAIGDVQQFRKQSDAALQSYEAALTLFKEIGDKLGEANVRKAIGDVQQFRKQSDAALKSYEAALTLFKEIGDKLGEANVLAAQCRLLVQAGELAQAEKNLAQVIAIRREIGDLYSEGADYGNFAIALLNVGEKATAQSYALKAKQVFQKIGEPSLIQQVDRLIAACD